MAPKSSQLPFHQSRSPDGLRRTQQPFPELPCLCPEQNVPDGRSEDCQSPPANNRAQTQKWVVQNLWHSQAPSGFPVSWAAE